MSSDPSTPKKDILRDISKGFIHEVDYRARDYTPLGPQPSSSMCTRCVDYYKELYEKGLTDKPFIPNCKKHIMESIGILRKEDFQTEEEWMSTISVIDPITWAFEEFEWRPRWYQEWYLSCTSALKILRQGRRCLGEGTIIPTKGRLKRVEDVCPGDIVYDEYGKETEVVEVYNNGYDHVTEIIVDGTIVARATSKHKFLVLSVNGYTLECAVADLIPGDKLLTYSKKSKKLVPVDFTLKHCKIVCHTYDIKVNTTTSLYQLSKGVITHNSGKTNSMIIETLHFLFTTKNAKIIMVAPRETQVAAFFDEISRMIGVGKSVRDSIARYTKNPARLEFKNGSTILGFTLNPNQGEGASVTIRGQDAHLIVVDEMDFIADKDLDVLFAIKASHPECKIIAASTPSGSRGRFYQTCISKNIGWKEFWMIGQESPMFTEETDRFFKSTFSEIDYVKEVYADFGELGEGVFKKKAIEDSLQDYVLDDIMIEPNTTYILGVDWNKSNGTHMCILQHINNQLKLVRKLIIPEEEFLQSKSVDYIIELHSMWHFKYIFVDAGYGAVQVEQIKLYGSKHPRTKLDKILHPVSMNRQITVKDASGGENKKPAKAFLVQSTAKLLEDGNLVLPLSEDVESGSVKLMPLVQQLRNYKVESYSIYGQPVYSKTNEHTLIAYILAVGGYFLHEADLFKGPVRDARFVGIEVTGPQEPAVGNSITTILTQKQHEETKKGNVVRDLDVGKTRKPLNSISSSLSSRRNSENGIKRNYYRRNTF